jgi:predicted methyltransferase
MAAAFARTRGISLGVSLTVIICAMGLCAIQPVHAADAYDAAVQHTGRTDADLKRDALDHPADVLRLAGIKPGMHVADLLAGDGYYSELLSYVVGPHGHVLLLNNPPFEKWSDNGWKPRLANNRLPNVEYRIIDLNHMELPDSSLDAVLLIKVYHDLYWVDPEGTWPKIDTKAVLDQVARALKPGGTLLIVDHSAKAGTGNTVASSLHRIDEAFARQDFESRGLKLVAHSDVLRKPEDPRDQISYKPPALGKTDRFVLVFRKRAN